MLLRLLIACISAVVLALGAFSGVVEAQPPGEPPVEQQVEEPEGFPAMDTAGLVRIEAPGFEVWVTPEAEEGFRKVLERTAPRHARIRASLGVKDTRPIRVVVVEELNGYFVRRGLSRGAPPWAVGLAISRDQTILVKWGRSDNGTFVDLDKTFVHELAHVELDRRVGEVAVHTHGVEHVTQQEDGRRRVPRWFHEGFAIEQAGEWTLERSEALMQAGLGGGIISLHDLREGFPASGFAVELAYAESYHFLLYLDDRFGAEKRIAMLDEMAAGRTFEEAFFAAYHVEFGRVEQEWHDRLSVTYTWIPVALGSSVFWFLAGVIFIGAWARRRRATRARLAAMDDEEEAVVPAPAAAIPLPGMGLTEQHVRARAQRTFYDGSWIPVDEEADAHVQAARVPEEEPDDEVAWPVPSDEVPRTPDGHTIH